MKSNKPNLFILGFQKCGSSTLSDILTTHSEISGTKPKEMYFFADKGYDHYDYKHNIDNPSAKWDKFLRSENKIMIEASVCNFYQKNALDYIKKAENTKVIFIVRDPIARFISVYKYLYGKIGGITPKTSIDDFFERLNNHSYERHILKYAIEHGKYHKYINLWKKEIGKERIHIIGMKHLIKDSNKTILDIHEFLGVGYEEIYSISHKNKSKSFAFPILHQYLVKVFGGSVFSNRLTKSLYSKFFLKTINPAISSELYNKLMIVYKDEYDHYAKYFI